MEWLSSMSLAMEGQGRVHFRGNPQGGVLFLAELSRSTGVSGPRSSGPGRLNRTLLNSKNSSGDAYADSLNLVTGKIL